MKIKILLNLFLVLILTSTPFAYAAHKKAGTTSASFLKVALEAEATSLGETYVGKQGGVKSILYNPAGVDLRNNKSQISFSYNNSFQDTDYGFLSYLNSRQDKFSYALSFLYATIRDIREKEKDPTQLTQVINKGTLPANDLAFILSLAKPIRIPTLNLSLGTNLKLLRSKLDKETAFGLAIDVGILVLLNSKSSLGLSIQNLGAGLKYIKERDPLPLNIKVGSAIYLLKDNRLLVLIDLNKPLDNNFYLNTGLELNLFRKQLSLRYGYASGPSDIGKGISLGLGINIKEKYNLDLSYTPYGELGNMIKVGLGADIP